MLNGFETPDTLETLDRIRIEGASFLSWAVAGVNPTISKPTKLRYVHAVCREEKDMAWCKELPSRTRGDVLRPTSDPGDRFFERASGVLGADTGVCGRTVTLAVVFVAVATRGWNVGVNVPFCARESLVGEPALCVPSPDSEPKRETVRVRLTRCYA